MEQSIFPKHLFTASALICLIAILPALAWAQDFDGGGFDFGSDAGGFDFGGGDFFGSDTGGSFDSDTGITFGGDAGGFFGSDAGVTFEESGTDTGSSPGGDTGIGTVEAGGDTGSLFGGDIGFFFEDDTSVASGFDFSGVDVGGGFGFDSGGFSDSGGPSAEPGLLSAGPAPAIITETLFSEPTAPAPSESIPFFPTAGPEPFFFSGSEPLPVLSISEPLQAVTLHRSSITLAEIPYTGVGGVLAMAAFVFSVFGLSGIAAYWLTLHLPSRRQPSPALPPRQPQWKTRAAFAGW